jgi:hercynylcysteine S-oxide lyase
MDLPSATPEAPSTLRACAFANVKLPLTISPQDTNPKTGEIPHSDIRTVTNWLQATLAEKYDTFIAVILYRGCWWVRLSGMIYLEAGDFEWAGNVLKGLCEEVRAGRYGEKVEVQIQSITEKVGKL